MKKKFFYFSLIFLLFILLFEYVKITKAYTVEKAIKNGDFMTYPEQKNSEKFYEFIANVNEHIDSKIRITEYSKEGIPKVNDLNFSNNVIILHSFYPNNLINKEEEIGEYTNIYFEGIGDDKDMYLINTKLGVKTYICQIKNY